MKTRLYADLTAFVRAACTHSSHLDREVPLLPFYVREHPVGWLRPSFADLLRRWPHVFEATNAFVSAARRARHRPRPDLRDGRGDARARDRRRDPRLARRAGEHLAQLRRAGTAADRARRHAPLRHDGLWRAPERLHAPRRASRTCGSRAARPRRASIPTASTTSWAGASPAATPSDETIRKEAWEEAGIPAAAHGRASPARPSCASSTRCPRACTARSSSPTTCGLPEDFRPQNQDGEVARLYCLSIPEAIEAILAGEFTLDAGAVTVDALAAHRRPRARGSAVPRPRAPAQALMRGTLFPLAATLAVQLLVSMAVVTVPVLAPATRARHRPAARLHRPLHRPRLRRRAWPRASSPARSCSATAPSGLSQALPRRLRGGARLPRHGNARS